MAHPHVPSPYVDAPDRATHAGLCATEPLVPTKSRNNLGSLGPRASISTRILTPTPPTSLTRRSLENKQQIRRNQHEVFSEHLRTWASNHDSSAHFHGSICLYPPGMCPGEDMELGKSVSCILVSAHTGNSYKKIVIRLFKSQRYHSQQTARATRDKQSGHYTVPYQLVIRSGSGWVPARQYLDKYHFAYHARSRCRPTSQSAIQASVSQSSPMVANSTAESTASTPSAGLAGLMSNNGIINLPGNHQVTSAAMTNSNSFVLSERHPTARPSALVSSAPTHPRLTGDFCHATETIKINPLFRRFLNLPQELQDEVLYQAVGYTRVIDLTQGMHSPPASTSPTSMSVLFQISKSVNKHMVPHIFISTNFHFGITGFTKFLWQVGPLNRSNIRHLTFHFSKASLLHCIRWMAADPVWELFEPPVATNPPTLMYFWRCQLQDLMKELNLTTLTVDIRDVPLTDVPMLIRIISTAMGSVRRIRVVDSFVRPDKSVEDFTQGLHKRFPDMQQFTWREMSLQYHNDYKHQRWHMRHMLALREVDLCPVLEAWMDKNKDFFDS